jgi:hypothetical protein
MTWMCESSRKNQETRCPLCRNSQHCFIEHFNDEWDWERSYFPRAFVYCDANGWPDFDERVMEDGAWSQPGYCDFNVWYNWNEDSLIC